jgi:hypothetical protein
MYWVLDDAILFLSLLPLPLPAISNTPPASFPT